LGVAKGLPVGAVSINDVSLTGIVNDAEKTVPDTGQRAVLNGGGWADSFDS
jgi:hypothetical protein